MKDLKVLPQTQTQTKMASLRRALFSAVPRILRSNLVNPQSVRRPILGFTHNFSSSIENAQTLDIDLSSEESKRRLFNRLLYRSKQRGYLELDLVLGKWVEDNIRSVDERGIKSLVHVLDLVIEHRPYNHKADVFSFGIVLWELHTGKLTMDKKSWPWKKKSSHKLLIEKSEASTAASESGTTHVDKVKQDTSTKSKYVQLSMESYTHLTGLEDQVKSYKEQLQSYEEQVQSCNEHLNSYEEHVQNLEEEVKSLNEKLSEANTEMTNKENLVKQHSKVAEEAVSGWEKAEAEAEAAALKSHLESVTLLKLTAEDRASHLDGALKECMRQIRNLKDDHEQKLHEVVLQTNKRRYSL